MEENDDYRGCFENSGTYCLLFWQDLGVDKICSYIEVVKKKIKVKAAGRDGNIIQVLFYRHIKKIIWKKQNAFFFNFIKNDIVK